MMIVVKHAPNDKISDIQAIMLHTLNPGHLTFNMDRIDVDFINESKSNFIQHLDCRWFELKIPFDIDKFAFCKRASYYSKDEFTLDYIDRSQMSCIITKAIEIYY